MTGAATDPLKDVVLLMMVREMPREAFDQLCEDLLDGVTDAQILEVYGRQYLAGLDPIRTNRTRLDQLGCELCKGPVGVTALSLACHAGTGIWACKACVDEALAEAMGPASLDPRTSRTVDEILARKRRYA